MNKSAKPIKLAIFDIDGTIFRSSLLIEVINPLVKAGIFPSAFQKEYDAWLNRIGNYEDYINKLVQMHLRYIKGHSKKEMESVARQMLKSKKYQVYRFSRDLIAQLRKKGYFLIAISNSPNYVVGPYAKFLKFDAAFGSDYTLHNDVFTGEVRNLGFLKNKSLHLKKWLKENPRLRVDLKNSIAVGDTESDIPLLAMVGKPIAFNPNLLLARYAQKHGWQIVAERKDVIYDLKKFKFI